MNAPYASESLAARKPVDQPAMLALAGLTLLAAALRLFHLDAQSLWMDEVASFQNAQAFGRAGMKGLAAADHIAPLHSIILWCMVQIGGQNAIALRLPSALAGIATIPAIWWVGIRMFRCPRIALIAAGLAAISPYAVWYSQEARMYALLLLCATLFVALCWPLVERRLSWAELTAVTIVSTIGFYTHHYMVLVSFAFGLFLLLREGPARIIANLREPRLSAWVATQAIAFALFAYWLALTANKLHDNAGFSKPALLLWTPYTFFSFVVGLSFGPSTHDLRTGLGPALRQDWLPIAIAGISTGLVMLRGLRAAFAPGRAQASLWLLLWIVVPIGLAIFATFVTNIQYNVRYVIFCFPAFVLLLALGIDAVIARWPRFGASGIVFGAAAAAMVACMLVALANWYGSDRYAKEDVRPLARLLVERPGQQMLIADNNRIALPLSFYGAPLPTLAVDNILWARTPSVVVNTLDREQSTLPPEVWLVEYRSWEGDPQGQVQQWLDKHGHLAGTQTWPGVSLRRYAMPQGLVAPQQTGNR
jgi:uncharacterized membrane protein